MSRDWVPLGFLNPHIPRTVRVQLARSDFRKLLGGERGLIAVVLCFRVGILVAGASGP